MKYLSIFTLLLILFTSCKEENVLPSSGYIQPDIIRPEFSEMINHTTGATSTFSYNEGGIASSSNYTYERNINIIKLYNKTTGSRTPDYEIVLGPGEELESFTSNLTGGRFLVTSQPTDPNNFWNAKWKKCTSCEDFDLVFRILEGGQFGSMTVKNELNNVTDRYFAFQEDSDGKNPFHHSIHYPESFLEDYRNLIWFANSNAIASIKHDDFLTNGGPNMQYFDYEYNEDNFPTKIYRETSDSPRTLFQELSY